MFVRSDDERALKSEWNIYIIMKEIIYELFAMNTFIQNEHNERMREILLMKTRAMKIQAELSAYLWFWII